MELRRDTSLSFREIGVRLAFEEGRRMAYCHEAVRKAVARMKKELAKEVNW